MVTVTPGSTPPDASVIVPSMEPLAAVDCAAAGAQNASSIEKTALILSMVASIPMRIAGCGFLDFLEGARQQTRALIRDRQSEASTCEIRTLRLPDPFLRGVRGAEC